MSDGRRIDLPSGDSLWFYEEDHSYWRHNEETGKRGRRLSGVTTVCKPLDYNPENLIRWAAETQCKGIAELYLREPAEYLHWLTDPSLMWRRLNDEGLTYDKVRDLAGDQGTNVHVLAFEALARDKPGVDFTGFDGREKALAAAVAKFWFDHEPKASQVEQVVYSERLGVAGRLDFKGRLLAQCDNPVCFCQDLRLDHPGVIDLKTGGFISCAAHAQVGGGYPLLAEESGFGPSGWAAILQVFDDGHYEFFKAEGSPEAFEAAVETYRHAGKINGAAGKAREGRKTARVSQEEIDAAVEAVAS
jgi:hypothetical protein